MTVNVGRAATTAFKPHEPHADVPGPEAPTDTYSLYIRSACPHVHRCAGLGFVPFKKSQAYPPFRQRGFPSARHIRWPSTTLPSWPVI